jgi:hypothetical protein
MTSGTPLLRTLVIYGVCLPLAVIVGYVLAYSDWSTMYIVGLIMGVLALPFLLKLHHPFLLLTWNCGAVAFLLPGRPSVWLLVAAGSLTISILQRTLVSGKQFWSPSSLTWPLIVLAVVALLTAQLNGGVGFRVLGSETYGGRRIFDLLGAVLGYFALTAQRIPPNRALLFCGLFFLGGITKAIGSFMDFAPASLTYIFLIFPPERMFGSGFSEFYLRFGGFGLACTSVVSFFLVRYGLRGVLLATKPWRIIVFFAMVSLALFGGFRSMLILLLLTLAIQFYLEGLHKSKLLPVLLLAMVLGAVVLLPMTRRLPLQFQRALAVLPVDVDPRVRADAEASTEWRVSMWRDLRPEIPKRLLLGKGFAFDAKEFAKEQSIEHFGKETSGSVLVGDYHNGPLSIIIPLGIWGVIAFLWFIWAGLRVLYANYKFCDPEFKTMNTAILAAFLAKTILFFVIFGALSSELVAFTGLLGLSVSLNSGVCKRVDVPERRPTYGPPTPIALRPPRPAIAGAHFNRTSAAG